jgi:endonuclease-3
MSTSNRAGLYKKTFRVLKKHYKPVIPVADRSLLEHLLYACCLENSQPETADEAYAKLQENYFDWNEIRVTSVSELSETLNSLTDPVETATRLKQVLQVVFETYYAFDLEHLKKQNLGKTVKELEKYQGTTEFSVDYITQNGLAGHSIATSRGTIQTLVVLGIVSEAEAKKRRLPGMERAIAKPKGVEFTSLLHQLGTDFDMTPFSSRVRAILLEIAADAKLRFPKRKTRKKAAEEVAQPAAPEKAATKKAATKKAATKKAATKKAATKKAAKGKKTITKKASKPKAAKRKQAARKKTAKPAAKRPAKRKPR